VTDATTKISGAAFGAFFYNTVDAKGESYMLYALSGASREAFSKFGMPRNTEVFKKTFNGEGILRSDDITKDPRYGKNSPHFGMPKGHLPVVSYLAVPVISKSGIVIGGLFLGHPEAAVFQQKHEILVAAISSQAALALDNARLYEEVQALNSRKDEFIGFASHELKTPLTTISGYLQMAEENPELSEEFVPRINRQVARLSGIVSDLLDISKIQAGKLELNFGHVSLNKLIKESVETVHATTHSIKCVLPKDDIVVNVDESKMSQVLVNLLSNAIKYSPEETEITVTASRYGDEIRINVEDHGFGIPPADIEKIFSQFYRVEEHKSRQPGLGLGLFISKEMVEGHGGKIWAESIEGIGSKFHLHFPIVKTNQNSHNFLDYQNFDCRIRHCTLPSAACRFIEVSLCTQKSLPIHHSRLTIDDSRFTT
jgi:signal transduction histidine kinase